jgi:hypothetical protein
MQQACRGKIASLSQLREIDRHRLELIERPIGLSMPELPLQRSDVGVDMSYFAVLSVTPTLDMIGDLVQRLDLHAM